jgi:hypothetical protein
MLGARLSRPAGRELAVCRTGDRRGVPHARRRRQTAATRRADADADAAPPHTIPPPHVWRRELAHLAPLLRDPTRAWALPLALRLCYERNADEAAASGNGRALLLSQQRSPGAPAQWASDVLARRAAAERALAAAAHAVRAAHARVGLLRRLVGLEDEEEEQEAERRRARRTATSDSDTSNPDPDPLQTRRWITAQEADKERTTLLEARKAAERASKAVRAAAGAAASWGDADFTSRRAPRMAALARGLAAHATWLQRTALREVLSAGRRNAEEAAAVVGGRDVAAVAAAGEDEDEGDEGDDDDNNQRRSSFTPTTATSPRFPRVAGLVAAYHSVALACFDCYSDPDLERRLPGPGLPTSAGRRFPRLVPQQALFPPDPPRSSEADQGADDRTRRDRRRLAAARRLLAVVDDVEAMATAAAEDEEEGRAAKGSGRQLQRMMAALSLDEVDEGLAEDSYGLEPLPPMAVLLERAGALDQKRRQAAARRGSGGGRGIMEAQGDGPLPLPLPGSTTTTRTTRRRSAAFDEARPGGGGGWRKGWRQSEEDGGG